MAVTNKEAIVDIRRIAESAEELPADNLDVTVRLARRLDDALTDIVNIIDNINEED
jgi:hypothetical protein